MYPYDIASIRLSQRHTPKARVDVPAISPADYQKRIAELRETHADAQLRAQAEQTDEVA